jgi:hypothetical protein
VKTELASEMVDEYGVFHVITLSRASLLQLLSPCKGCSRETLYPVPLGSGSEGAINVVLPTERNIF